MDLSPLRAHKFRHNFRDTSDPFCTVCESIEDTEHFFLQCQSFRLERVNLTQSISNICVDFDFDRLPRREKVQLLLYGDKNLDLDNNRSILEEVGKFIHKSKRLDII